MLPLFQRVHLFIGMYERVPAEVDMHPVCTVLSQDTGCQDPLGTAVPGGCVGAGDQIWVLCKTSEHSESLNHLFLLPSSMSMLFEILSRLFLLFLLYLKVALVNFLNLHVIYSTKPWPLIERCCGN